ncbi:SpoIIE family protein phosphatase [Streptomyces sp. TRM 70361]|uniref:SpoIIE family protein phosphatase n=1 Tax=Streptomyces sp. TRM 70361 TaxID=3116553 RepID=UPI002E7B5657|nr:SpoIIE family protein phosphatase [Streptomyces sp. TRM 70361]MEE1941670.1 SpoIIE family protein phosphatase [Streptomyces sp. TRM 70361]
MNPTAYPHGTGGRPPDGAAVFVLDASGTVLECTTAAQTLTGRSGDELRGRPFADLTADPGAWPGPPGGTPAGPWTVHVTLSRRDGPPAGADADADAEVDVEVLPLPAAGEARFLLCAVPSEAGRRWSEDQALLRTLFAQSRIGLAIHDTGMRTIRANLGPEHFGAPRTAGSWAHAPGRHLRAILVPEDAAAVEERWRRVMETGEAVIDWEHSARRLYAPGRERMLSSSAFRLEDSHGRTVGVVAIFTDITEQTTARRRLALLHAAASRLGRILDVTRNAEELTGVLVPAFADLACVDLSDAVSQGRESAAFLPGTVLRRVAVAASDGVWPADTYRLGDTVRAREAESDALREGGTVLVSDMAAWREQLRIDPERLRLLFPGRATSALFVPLWARGHVLGVLGLWRTGDRPPFAEGDVPLVEEIASRAALSLENARRYTAELRTVESLQRSLLPPEDADLGAARTAGSYVPAGTAAGLGGCWYDVIPLSSARVAFVIGDVAGHGLAATATMGRLRTAVQTLADLDLSPEELLTHLDDLAIRLSAAEPRDTADGVVGTTCLYCVYDPVTGRCAMASAGHPAPVLAGPGGDMRPVELSPGPALGVGGMPFEPVELRLAPGSVLAFCTRDLAALHEDTAGAAAGGGGPSRPPHESVAAAVAAGRPPAEIGRAVLDHVLTEPPADDVALLVAEVRALPEDATAAWRFTADPTVVARARQLATDRLTDWGLEDLTFTTELIVSELVTNAVRYAGPPVELRLIRDRTLICEVSDPSQTQPHLRRARLTDEGGRGLFLVAQLAHRWGSRYTASGKTIWTEQPLDAPPGTPSPDLF